MSNGKGWGSPRHWKSALHLVPTSWPLSPPPRSVQPSLEGPAAPVSPVRRCPECSSPAQTVSGQLAHPEALGGPGLLQTLHSHSVRQLCWLQGLQFIGGKGKAGPAARHQGSGVGTDNGGSRPGGSCQTLAGSAGSGDPGKAKQPDLAQTKSPSRMASS